MGSVEQKIRRALELRRLARRTTAGPEREAALRAARGIMRKYAISERDILVQEKQLAAETHEDVTVLADQNEQAVIWRQALAQTVVRVYGLIAHHESMGRKRIYVVGAEEVRAMAAADLKTIAASMTAAARPWATKPNAHTMYLEGCVLGFSERLGVLYDAKARRRGLMVLRPPERRVDPPPRTPAPTPVGAPPPKPPPPPPKPVVMPPKAPPTAPAPRMVSIGQPPDPRTFEDGKRMGTALADTYFALRYDDSLALRFQK
jgi:hypothetical protein